MQVFLDVENIYIIFFFIFLFGLSIGSFLNVLIYRVPNKIFVQEKFMATQILGLPKENFKKTSLLSPSKCPKCDQKIKYHHNIPLLGWFLLKGKCYFCQQRISFEYPLVELTTAITFIVIFYCFEFSLQSFALIILSMFFIPLFFIDSKHQILPDSFTLTLVWIGIIINYYNIFTTLEQSVWGAIVGYLSLWSIYWIYKIFSGKEGFGYGDFKLLAAVGSWFGCAMLLYSIFVSCIFGIIIAIGINLLVKRTNVISFGPAIILSTSFYLLTKNNLYVWYSQNILMDLKILSESLNF